MIGRLSSSVLDSLARKSRTLAVESEAKGSITNEQVRREAEDEVHFLPVSCQRRRVWRPDPCRLDDQSSATSISTVDDASLFYSYATSASTSCIGFDAEGFYLVIT